MVIPYGDRSNVVIEPMLTDQWFVDAPTLAREAIRAVEQGEMEFVPKSYEKTYLNGCAIFSRGVFPVSFGGGTRCRFGMDPMAKFSVKKTLTKLRRLPTSIMDGMSSLRGRPMCWIHGSLPVCGHSLPWAGLIKPSFWIRFIRHRFS